MSHKDIRISKSISLLLHQHSKDIAGSYKDVDTPMMLQMLGVYKVLLICI